MAFGITRYLVVRAVAQGGLARVLAAAQPHLAGLGQRPAHGRDAGALVRAIAEWLAFGAPAGTPPVIARLQIDGVGALLRDQRIRHDDLPVVIKGA